jgi:hypothetical protein
VVALGAAVLHPVARLVVGQAYLRIVARRVVGQLVDAVVRAALARAKYLICMDRPSTSCLLSCNGLTDFITAKGLQHS